MAFEYFALAWFGLDMVAGVVSTNEGYKNDACFRHQGDQDLDIMWECLYVGGRRRSHRTLQAF